MGKRTLRINNPTCVLHGDGRYVIFKKLRRKYDPDKQVNSLPNLLLPTILHLSEMDIQLYQITQSYN